MSPLHQAIDAHLDVYTRSPEFKAFISRLLKWGIQGYEKGFNSKHREAFTATVAARIHSKARSRRITLLGHTIWRTRYPYSWCEEQAEKIVTEWLRDEKIKFGDPAFDWSDGRDIADEEMSHWEQIG